MKRIEIIVGGEAYPCGTLTMGALLRFEKETGRNAMQVLSPEGIAGLSFSDVGTLMWACAASATRAEGRDFRLPLLDFLDACPPDVAQAWLTAALGEQQADVDDTDDAPADDEKKSPTA